MATLTYMEASKRALAEEMRRDATVWCVGEDLGRGGVFGQYTGLVDEFGAQRISDAPISEACIMGAAMGAAMMGTRPVVEMRFSDFALCAIDELVNQAVKARFMFGGQTTVPLVAREPIGMWRSSAAQHSQSLEAWYTHIPGLIVVCPSTAQDNYLLLKAAIRANDPVVYMEHKNLWGVDGEVSDAEAGDEEIASIIGKARTLRSGKDLSIVSWSATVHEAAAAAHTLAEQGIDAEVIDLRSLWPWDKDAIYTSVRKTGRLLVTHEAVSVGGFGAEIAASVSEHCYGALQAPVKRLGAPRAPISYAPSMEAAVSITAEKIADAATSLARM